MRQTGRRFLVAFANLVLGMTVLGAEPGSVATEPFDPAGIGGAIVLYGGGQIPESTRDVFFDLAGGKEGRFVVIPSGGDDDTIEQDGVMLGEFWRARGASEVASLHTRARDTANDEEFVAPLRQATGVWIGGGRQTQIATTYYDTRVERELRALVERGGVVAGNSAGAACLSRVMLVRERIYETPGLGILPGVIVDQHFLVRNRKERLFVALEKHPALVGLGVDEATALVIRGRSLKCIGDSTVTICLAGNERAPRTEFTLTAGEESDLTMWRRQALQRVGPTPAEVGAHKPEVPQGALVIVGGGGVPEEISRRFIELAGGPDALIVVLPTANPDPLPEKPNDGRFLERAGAKNVRVLKQRRRADVESPEFLDVLKEARGVWFGGGRQWRFVDAYEGTRALDAFRDVLARGGVIGGSSAGATIQGEYLVRGSPLGNEQMMCPGYEQGFAFLPGAAIDQHVAQRKRFADLIPVVASHPQLLGIGLDESTALIVRGRAAEIMGKGEAHFYDRRKPVVEGQPEYESFAAGAKYDLVHRAAVPAE